MDARVLRKELKIGVPGALQACAYGVTNVVIQASVNSFGTDTAAGWAAYGKLDMIFWTVSSALGAAVTTFAGQNYGAGKMDRVYKSIRVNVVISYIFTRSYYYGPVCILRTVIPYVHDRSKGHRDRSIYVTFPDSELSVECAA